MTSQPVSVFKHVNTTASLSSEATGSDPISYQWRRINGNISSERATGVNTPTLNISSVKEEDEDEYYCMVSNGGIDGRRYYNKSQNAAITVYGLWLFALLGIIAVSIFQLQVHQHFNHLIQSIMLLLVIHLF